MAKFYVESGNVRMVVQAECARGAAVWLAHRAMSQLMPFLGEEGPSESLPFQTPVVLGPSISTHEQGFGHSDRQTHDTFEIITEWNRLLVALDKLQADFHSLETTGV